MNPASKFPCPQNKINQIGPKQKWVWIEREMEKWHWFGRQREGGLIGVDLGDG